MLRQNNESMVELRQQLAALPTMPLPRDTALPFGLSSIDEHLPLGGLALGRLHEFFGKDGINDEAAAVLFVAGILARLEGPIIWCLANKDLFAPSLPQVGLDPERIIFIEGRDERTVLMAMEESLRCPGMAGVVGELKSLSMTASRRLHLAARTSGVTAFGIRRNNRETGHNATASRWCMSCLPSSPLPTRGVGRARWLIELTRCRDGEPMEWIVEACDEKGFVALPADMANRLLPQTQTRALFA